MPEKSHDPWAPPPQPVWWQRWRAKIKAHESPIEESTRVRLATWWNSCLALVAHAFVAEEWWPLALAALAITCGSYLSHRWRHHNMVWVKAILAVGMLAALTNSLRDIALGAMDPRLALGSLLLYLQALNAFDLPRRRNMRVAWLVSSILTLASASLSREASFVLVLAVFALSLSWAAQLAHAADLGATPPPITARQSWRPEALTHWALFLASGLVVAGLAMLAPILGVGRSVRLDAATLPMSLPISLPHQLSPRLMQTAASLPDAAGGMRGRLGTAGFSEALNLDVRSLPSEALALRVQATQSSYWRALAFDRYDGRGWHLSNPESATLMNNSSPPKRLNEPHQLVRMGGTLTATIHVERDQGNVIFAPYEARRMYFPSAVFYRDELGGLRSPVLLEKGMYYTVEAMLPPPFEALESLNFGPQPDGMASYLQLPTLSPRVKALASQLARGKRNDWAKVDAIRQAIASFPYRLDIPPAPAGAEWVDHFLFVQKAGFCEQFATAGAVLARQMGVPARLVTGYTAGTWNPFSGLYELRGKDAHAWVEVHLPRVGWVPVDFTPQANGESEGLFGGASKPSAVLMSWAGAWLLLAMLCVSAARLWRWWQAERRLSGSTRAYRQIRRAAAARGVSDAVSLAPGPWLAQLLGRLQLTEEMKGELEAFLADHAWDRFGPPGRVRLGVDWSSRGRRIAKAIKKAPMR